MKTYWYALFFQKMIIKVYQVFKHDMQSNSLAKSIEKRSIIQST